MRHSVDDPTRFPLRAIRSAWVNQLRLAIIPKLNARPPSHAAQSSAGIFQPSGASRNATNEISPISVTNTAPVKFSVFRSKTTMPLPLERSRARIAVRLAKIAPMPSAQMLMPIPSDIAATSIIPGKIMSLATAYSMTSTAPGQGTIPAARANRPLSNRPSW